MKAIARAAALTALAFFAAAPAFASITRIVGPTPLFGEPKLFIKFEVAYDSFNKVYLVAWGTQASSPTKGLFLDQNGAPIGGVFAISQGTTVGAGLPCEAFTAGCVVPQAGWANVAYDPEHHQFLVAYTKIFTGSLQQRTVRVVAYSNGLPAMPNEVPIDLWAGNQGGDSQMVYSTNAHKYLITNWNWVLGVPATYVTTFDPTNNQVGPKTVFTDTREGESDPKISCDMASNTCLVVGWSSGLLSSGGELAELWGRFITATDAAPP